jgi:RNA polymerase sigma-70 factor (ECF subfamily)
VRLLARRGSDRLIGRARAGRDVVLILVVAGLPNGGPPEFPVIFARRWEGSDAGGRGRPGRGGAGHAGGPTAERQLDTERGTAWLDDAALVERARDDAEAFGLLYDRYCDPIFGFVRRRLPDRESAEDVTADVFLKALRAIDGYQPSTAPFSAWLYRIAANAVTDHLRARRVTTSLDEPHDRPDRAGLVEDRVIDRIEADRVWAAVERLVDAQRTAVTLRLGHDLPIAQIASRMARSEGAVKLLLNRGLKAVRLDLAAASSRDGWSERDAGDDERTDR